MTYLPKRAMVRAMIRVFFDANLDESLQDSCGEVHATHDAAIEAARRTARELAADAVRGGLPISRRHAIRVRDENGAPVAEVRLVDVVHLID